MRTSRSIATREASASRLRAVLSFCAWNLRDPGIAHSRHVARVRATCREWAMPGSRRFHAQKESTARRRLALASLVAMERDVRIVLVESAQGRLQLEARGAH